MIIVKAQVILEEECVRSGDLRYPEPRLGKLSSHQSSGGVATFYLV